MRQCLHIIFRLQHLHSLEYECGFTYNGFDIKFETSCWNLYELVVVDSPLINESVM